MQEEATWSTSSGPFDCCSRVIKLNKKKGAISDFSPLEGAAEHCMSTKSPTSSHHHHYAPCLAWYAKEQTHWVCKENVRWGYKHMVLREMLTLAKIMLDNFMRLFAPLPHGCFSLFIKVVILKSFNTRPRTYWQWRCRSSGTAASSGRIWLQEGWPMFAGG